MSEQSILMVDTDEELKKIIRQLNSLPDQIAAPKILKNALNSTARKVRAQVVRDAKERYAITDKRALKEKARGAPQVNTASVSSLTATVRSRGPMQDIMTFMTQPNTATGAAAAKVLKNGSMKELEKGDLKAFVTRFASGHVAIVQRRGEERLPVKKLLSPAIPHLLGNEEVRAQAEVLAYDILQNEIQKRIQKINAVRA